MHHLSQKFHQSQNHYQSPITSRQSSITNYQLPIGVLFVIYQYGSLYSILSPILSLIRHSSNNQFFLCNITNPSIYTYRLLLLLLLLLSLFSYNLMPLVSCLLSPVSCFMPPVLRLALAYNKKVFR